MIIKKNEEKYPLRLSKLNDMPEILYGIGEVPKNENPTLAIVGARNCSHYGENMAYEYAKVLAGMGVQIISGLARGIDTAAHRGALAGGGETYAVLGCGVDICYPASNKILFEKIKRQGGILSEYENGCPPLAYHFPRRNRIISGLSDAVLIIEAKEKSGSLITADFALEQGKTVFALPGRVGDLLSAGCNRLIYQGAIPAWCPEMILEEMNWEIKSRKNGREENGKKELGLAREDNLVYSCLNLNPKTVIQLQEETGFSSSVLMNCLTNLLVSGLIKEVWKNNYVRC